MKVFVAGAAGAVGNRLVPLLVRNGHEVTAMTRSSRKADWARQAGAIHVAADGLDRDAVRRAVAAAKPDVIIHQMTALTDRGNLKEFDTDFAVTNRLRTEGTDHLLEAARDNGVRRIVAQSYGNWNHERTGTAPKRETDPLDPIPPANQRQTLAAIRYIELAVTEAAGIEGVALRYGNFYGPNTGFAPNGNLTAVVRNRQLPIVGNGAGVWSFIHVDDAAAATMAAMTGPTGVFNVCDDDPAPIATWLPEFARIIGAKSPTHVPVWLGRLFVGEVGVSMMTRIRGGSNKKARAELGWTPIYPSWRAGFAHDFRGQSLGRAAPGSVAAHA